MIPRPTSATRTDTHFPYTARFRSRRIRHPPQHHRAPGRSGGGGAPYAGGEGRRRGAGAGRGGQRASGGSGVTLRGRRCGEAALPDHDHSRRVGRGCDRSVELRSGLAVIKSSLREAWGGGPPPKAVVEGKFGGRAPFPSTSCGWSPSPSRSEEHTSELQSLMRISYAVFCLKKKNKQLIV